MPWYVVCETVSTRNSTDRESSCWEWRDETLTLDDLAREASEKQEDLQWLLPHGSRCAIQIDGPHSCLPPEEKTRKLESVRNSIDHLRKYRKHVMSNGLYDKLPEGVRERLASDCLYEIENATRRLKEALEHG